MRVYCQRGHKKQKMILSKQHRISNNSYTIKVQVAENWNLQEMGIQVRITKLVSTNLKILQMVTPFPFLLCEYFLHIHN